MKALLKFLLNTEVGRELTRLIIGAVIRLFKRKVLEKMRQRPRMTLEQVLQMADNEIHADLAGAKPTDLL